MKRTTVMFPAKLKADAARAAARNGESLGEYIRQSVQRSLGHGESGRSKDRFFSDKFTFEDNGPPDLAANADHYLLELRIADYQRQQQDARKHRLASKRRKTRAAK